MVVQLVVGAPPAKRRYVWRQRKQPWKGGNWCDLVGLPKVPDIGREGWQSGSWRRITRQTVDVWRKLVSYKFDEGSEPARWFLLRLMWFISWWHERLLKGRKMHRDHSWMGSNPLIEYGSTDCWPKKKVWEMFQILKILSHGQSHHQVRRPPWMPSDRNPPVMRTAGKI